jgi:hypothetical protein
MDNRVIKSGAYSYLCKQSHLLAKQGYVCISQKRWADGKYTMVFEKKEKTQ